MKTVGCLVVVGGIGHCEAGVGVGEEFVAEGGDGEVVEGGEVGGGGHAVGR